MNEAIKAATYCMRVYEMDHPPLFEGDDPRSRNNMRLHIDHRGDVHLLNSDDDCEGCNNYFGSDTCSEMTIDDSIDEYELNYADTPPVYSS